MKLSEIVAALDLEVRAGADHLDREVTGAYASDLLSDVMGHASEGALWITLQVHQNIVAVAVMKSLAGIVLVKNREPDEATMRKAEEEEIPLLISSLGAFELAGKLFGMGLSGS
ncbi:MAG: serine kinase [Candidatus Eisenbacteria bacterium]|nr:serine kinase [Candidatus Eisenbacteria bacterium]